MSAFKTYIVRLAGELTWHQRVAETEEAAIAQHVRQLGTRLQGEILSVEICRLPSSIKSAEVTRSVVVGDLDLV